MEYASKGVGNAGLIENILKEAGKLSDMDVKRQAEEALAEI